MVRSLFLGDKRAYPCLWRLIGYGSMQRFLGCSKNVSKKAPPRFSTAREQGGWLLQPLVLEPISRREMI